MAISACKILEVCQSFSYNLKTKTCDLFKTQNRTCYTLIGPKSPPLAKCRRGQPQTRKFMNDQPKFGKRQFLNIKKF